MPARSRMHRPPPRPGLVLHLDSVRLTEYDDDGFLGVQIDEDGEQGDNPALEAQVAPFEALHAYGFTSRPLDPDVDGNGRLSAGAMSLTLWEGARGYSVPLHDSRVVPALATLKPGESVQYGPANNFVRCHADGRISMMCTTDGTETGQTVSCVLAPDSFTCTAPWGTLRHDGYGFHYKHVSGARLDIGGMSGLPAPLDAASSYAHLEAFVVTIKGTTVQLGTGTFDNVAKATPTLAVLASQGTADTALVAALTALQAVLASVPGSGGAAGSAVPVANAIAALQAAAAAIGASTLTIPAASVQAA